MQIFQRALFTARNPDVRWLRENLVPRLMSDLKHASGGLVYRDGTHRVFRFDEQDVDFRAKWQKGSEWVVVLRARDTDEPAFGFAMRGDKPGKVSWQHAAGKDDPSVEALTETAAKLRAFGEHYLANPISHFNYATPGEYLEWPDRSLIEPDRDPQATDIEVIDEEIRKKVTSLHGIQRLTPDERKETERQIRDLGRFRNQELMKTTHGRWLMRNVDEYKPKETQQAQSVVAREAGEGIDAPRAGFYLVSADQVLLSSMGDYHPSWNPDYEDLGDPSDPATWAEAYHLKDTLEEALREARDESRVEFEAFGGDGEVVEDYEARVHPAAVTADGELIVARDTALMLLDRAGDDSPASLLRAAGDEVIRFTREEVYASIGATPSFRDDGPGL